METRSFVVGKGGESRGVAFTDAQSVAVSGRRPGDETDASRKAKSESYAGGEVFAGSKESGHDETTCAKGRQHSEAANATNADQKSLANGWVLVFFVPS